MSLGNAYNRHLGQSRNRGTAPLRGLIAKTDVQEARYGVGGVSAYINEEGQIFPYRNIGGDVRFSGYEGDITVFRCPVMNYNGKNTARLFAEWRDRVKHSISTMTEEFLKLALINTQWNREREPDPISIDLWSENMSDVMDQLYIRNEYMLNRWFVLQTWDPIISDIYEGFSAYRSFIGTNDSKETSVKREKFFIASFADAKGSSVPLPSILRTASGAELIIEPPKASLAGITRVYVNMGTWLAVCAALGMSTKYAMMKYLTFETLYSTNKQVTVKDLLAHLAAEGFSPTGYVEDFYEKNFTEAARNFTNWGTEFKADDLAFRATRLVWDLIMSTFLLKLFSMVSQAIKPEDTRFTTKYSIFFPKMSDEQAVNQLKLLNDHWQTDQLHVPSGTLNSRFELLVLPIRRLDSEGYKVHIPINKDKHQHDSSEYESHPAIIFSDLDFKDMSELSEEGGATYEFVDLAVINNVIDEQILSLNKITGEIEMIDRPSVGIFGIVYPYSLHTIRPLSVAMKFEERHWPIIYKWFIPRMPIVTLHTRQEHSLYNQQSFFGPRKYLFNSAPLVDADDTVKQTFTQEILSDVYKTVAELVYISQPEESRKPQAEQAYRALKRQEAELDAVGRAQRAQLKEMQEVVEELAPQLSPRMTNPRSKLLPSEQIGAVDLTDVDF